MQPGEGRVQYGVPLLGAEFHHLHPAVGEGFHVDGEGEAQQAGDLQRGGALGVGHLVDVQLLLQQRQAFGVFGIADAGDGVLRAQLLGRQAAHHVQLVVARDGDNHVRGFHVGLDQGLDVGAVAPDAHHVQRFAGLVQRLLAAVQYGDVVAVLGKILGQRVAHLAVADDDDVQEKTSLYIESVNSTLIPLPWAEFPECIPPPPQRPGGKSP